MTYQLLPHPVTRHHVTILTLRVFKLSICSIVDVTVKLWVAKDTLDHLARVAEPNIIFRDLPFRWAGGFRWWITITKGKTLPGNIPKWDGVNLSQ